MCHILKDARRAKVLLLHYAREDVCDTFEMLLVNEATEDETIFDQTKALDGHFIPKKILEYEVYKFRKATQLAGEIVKFA